MSDGPDTLPYADANTPTRHETAHINGEGTYDNIRRVVVFREAGRVRLAPAPVQWSAWISVSVICALFFVGWSLLVWFHADEDERMKGVLAGSGVGVLTITALLVIPPIVARWERRRGDRLIVDTAARTVELPREGSTFAFADVRRVEICNGWRRDANGKRHMRGDENVGEWQLVVCTPDGGERRIIVLRESPDTHARQVREFAATVPFPVLKVSEGTFGGVTAKRL